MKLLWITPEWPFGQKDGPSVATQTLVSELTRRNISITMVSLVSSLQSIFVSQVKESFRLEDLFIIERQGDGPAAQKWLRLLGYFLTNPFFPMTLVPFYRKKVRQQMQLIVEDWKRKNVEDTQQYIVVDGLKPAAALVGILKSTPLIYRSHNVEFSLWEQTAVFQENWFVRFFLRWQGWLVKNFEKQIIAHSQWTFPVSESDARHYRIEVPGKTTAIKTLPIGIQFFHQLNRKEPEEPTKIRLIFVGKLDWLPNRQGLEWFFKNVWNDVSQYRVNMDLTIVGAGDAAWLDAYKNLSRIHFRGYQEDLSREYLESDIMIVPLFIGSGARIKVIEAASYGISCVGTRLAVSGTPLRADIEFIRVEEKREWIQVLESLERKKCRELGENAFRQLRETYDAGAIAQKFISLLNMTVQK